MDSDAGRGPGHGRASQRVRCRGHVWPALHQSAPPGGAIALFCGAQSLRGSPPTRVCVPGAWARLHARACVRACVRSCDAQGLASLSPFKLQLQGIFRSSSPCRPPPPPTPPPHTHTLDHSRVGVRQRCGTHGGRVQDHQGRGPTGPRYVVGALRTHAAHRVCVCAMRGASVLGCVAVLCERDGVGALRTPLPFCVCVCAMRGASVLRCVVVLCERDGLGALRAPLPFCVCVAGRYSAGPPAHRGRHQGVHRRPGRDQEARRPHPVRRQRNHFPPRLLRGAHHVRARFVVGCYCRVLLLLLLLV
jgi:hypothetical protein